jgi:hypothetical protein
VNPRRLRGKLAGRPVTTKAEPVSQLAALLGSEHRRVREAHNVSLEALAAHIERSVNVIRYHENGTRPMRVDDLCMSADFMGVSAAMLVVSPKLMPGGSKDGRPS